MVRFAYSAIAAMAAKAGSPPPLKRYVNGFLLRTEGKPAPSPAPARTGAGLEDGSVRSWLNTYSAGMTRQIGQF
jgi:hypothetical protein